MDDHVVENPDVTVEMAISACGQPLWVGRSSLVASDVLWNVVLVSPWGTACRGSRVCVWVFHFFAGFGTKSKNENGAALSVDCSKF